MNVTVLRRNNTRPTMWDMLFQDRSFGNIHAIIYDVQQNYTCVVGDELMVIIDDKVRHVNMVVGTVEAKWSDM